MPFPRASFTLAWSRAIASSHESVCHWPFGPRAIGSALHADAAAAAPPVAPRTVRNRRRSISRASVVTQRAVARNVALHVTVDAPAHRERRDLVHLRHLAHVAVTGDAAVRAQDFDMPLMREPDEPGKRMHADPLGRAPVRPGVAHLLDLCLVGRRRPADHLMASEAGLHRRDSRLARDRHRAVTVEAGDLILPGMDVVTKKNWLAGTLELPRVADDGRLVG